MHSIPMRSRSSKQSMTPGPLGKVNAWSHFRSMGVAGVIAVLVCASATFAQTVVVPPGDASTEPDPTGIYANRYPFATSSTLGDTTTRYQQVYTSSDFTSGPVDITQISFRAAAGSSAFTLTDSDIEINLSTTSAGVNSLDPTFANNVGADNTTVYDGSLSLSTTASGPPSGPNPFDLTITLTTAFAYDPSKGNLLLDVSNLAPSTSDGTIYFDADGSGTDTSSQLSFDSSETTSDIADSVGLVTQFTTTPIGSSGGGGGGGGGGGTGVPLPAAAFIFPAAALLAGSYSRRLRPVAA